MRTTTFRWTLLAAVLDYVHVSVSPSAGEERAGLLAQNDTVANYRCPPGFAFLNGQKHLYVSSSLSESTLGNQLKCHVSACLIPIPSDLPHALWRYSDSTYVSSDFDEIAFNATLRISCNHGYVLSGSTFIKCLPTGGFSDRFPSCLTPEQINREGNVSVKGAGDQVSPLAYVAVLVCLLTLFMTVLIAVGSYLWWKRCRNRARSGSVESADGVSQDYSLLEGIPAFSSFLTGSSVSCPLSCDRGVGDGMDSGPPTYDESLRSPSHCINSMDFQRMLDSESDSAQGISIFSGVSRVTDGQSMSDASTLITLETYRTTSNTSLSGVSTRVNHAGSRAEEDEEADDIPLISPPSGGQREASGERNPSV